MTVIVNSDDTAPAAPSPWIITPCIRSAALSREAGCNIYLKLETVQPSGSFKSRGVGHFLSKAILAHGPEKPIHFYCASGGNAGLACVTAATTLKRPATIVVPNSTSALMIQKLKDLGADVVQIGEHWVEADTHLREELLKKDENGVYVPPFDHEDIWEGNATIITELDQQMRGDYDAVVCSVGGGGLFSGVMEGLSNNGRLGDSTRPVKILALETKGADSLSLSIRNGKLSRLPGITSIATSLGATQVASKAFAWGQRKEVTSCVLNDAQAAMACVEFANDERIIVETSCGVSLASAYNDTLRTVLYPDLSDEDFEQLKVVIIVCGGSNITLDMLNEYKERYSKDRMVLQKFHSRRTSLREKLAAEKAKSIPFIMHDKEEHAKSRGPTCRSSVGASKPSIGILDEDEVNRQIKAFGQVMIT